MNTRERIIHSSLKLFNQHGERNVTTNHIAADLGISPDNLYYHFRNKAEIILALFLRYEARVDEYLVPPRNRPLSMQDKAGYLQATFDLIWDYRFLYRDLNHLLEQDEALRRHYGDFAARAMGRTRELFREARESGLLRASEEEIDALVTNMWVILTAWISFLETTARHADKATEITRAMVGRGIYQVLCLEAPYLSPEARLYLPRLQQACLDTDDPELIAVVTGRAGHRHRTG